MTGVSAGRNPVSFAILSHGRDHRPKLFSRLGLLDSGRQRVGDRGPYGTHGAQHAKVQPLLGLKITLIHYARDLVKSVDPSQINTLVPVWFKSFPKPI